MNRVDRPVSRTVEFHGVKRPVIVTMDPMTQRFTFREKGCRAAYSYPMRSVMIAAIMNRDKEA